MFGNLYKHFPSKGHLVAHVKEAEIDRKPWFSTPPYPPNLLLDQLGVAPSPPGTIQQQHNNLIHNLPLHYWEQRGTPHPRLFWDHLVFFNPPSDALIAREEGFPKGWREWLCKESAKGGKEMISSSVILWHWWCLKFLLVLILLKGKEKEKNKNKGSNWYKGIGFNSSISNILFGFMVHLPNDMKALGFIHPSIIFRLHLWFLFLVTS